MPSVQANGINLEYDTFGDPSDPTLLLVHGFTAQLIAWDEGFCRMLADRGFHVVRYDNRDVGLSSKIEDGPAPDLAAAFNGDTSSASYTLDDMADDAAGLLDALDAAPAHVVGVSMGGMIVQVLAIRHPEKVRSVCSIMSTTGDRSMGQATPEAMAALLTPPPQDREGNVERAVQITRVIGSPGFPFDEERIRRRAGQAYDRCFYPMGAARQLLAILASPDRTAALGSVSVPFLVIHGADDPLVTVSGGEATAKAVPGAELLIIEGMGHDLPEPLWPRITDAIAANAHKAERGEKAP